VGEADDGHRAAGTPETARSPFHRLQAHARRLQRMAVVLVAIVAVVPATLHVFFAARQLQLETARHAHHLALVVTAEAERGTDARARLARLLGTDGALAGLASVAIVGPDGDPALELSGHHAPRYLAHAAVRLPASAAPFTEVRVVGDDGPLRRQALRVLGIHFVVATLLGAAVYRLPMRSLRHAIDEVERTHVQLLHSAKLGAIGEVYASLAHEINNPLGIILSRVQLMRAATASRPLGGELTRDLEMIERHGTRIAQTVRSLLTFSRKTAFELRSTDLNGVVQEAVALVQRPFARHGITVVSELAPSLPTVNGSRDHLQQVFLNLLTNARDAMPDGGLVTVRTYPADGAVVGEVQDGGTGMPPDVKARVFEPFFTTKREGQGTGLGLSVSASIVQAHGGQIAVESAPGHGACFRVRLPVEVTAR
jgi:signal transduction histidine kinase